MRGGILRAGVSVSVRDEVNGAVGLGGTGVGDVGVERVGLRRVGSTSGGVNWSVGFGG